MEGGRERDSGSARFAIRSSLTHEEIAQMIGSSRETVTRLLSELKKNELIRLEGSTLVIRNRPRWKRCASAAGDVVAGPGCRLETCGQKSQPVGA